MYLQHVLLRFSGQILEMAAGAVVASLIVRLFGLEAVGHVGLIVATVGLLTIFLDIGFDDYFVKNIAQDHDLRHEFTNLLFLRVIFLAFFALAAAVVYLWRTYSTLDTWLYSIAVAYFALASLYETCNVVFLATQKYVLSSVVRLAAQLMKLVALGLFFFTFEHTIVALAWLMIIEVTSQLLVSVAWLKRLRVGLTIVSSQTIRNYFTFTWPFAVGAASGTLFQYLDKVVLGYLVDARAVGLLLAAGALYNPLDTFIKNVTNTILPKLAADAATPLPVLNRRLRQLVEFSTFLAGWLAVQLFVLARPAADIMYGSASAGVAVVAQTYVLLIFAKLWLRPYISLLTALDKHHSYQSLTSVLSPTLTIALYALLIPRLGVVAIPLTAAGKWFIVGLPLLLYSLRAHAPHVRLHLGASALTLGTSIAAMGITLAQLPWPLAWLMANGLYLAVCSWRGLIDGRRLKIALQTLTSSYEVAKSELTAR